MADSIPYLVPFKFKESIFPPITCTKILLFLPPILLDSAPHPLYTIYTTKCPQKSTGTGVQNQLLYTFIVIQPKVLYSQVILKRLVGFRRACAPVRCAHPSFRAHCHTNRGAARPSHPSQLRCFLFDPPKIKK
jgi:hypothetical protein